MPPYLGKAIGMATNNGHVARLRGEIVIRHILLDGQLQVVIFFICESTRILSDVCCTERMFVYPE